MKIKFKLNAELKASLNILQWL